MGSKEPTTAGDKFPPFWSQLLQIIQSDVALGKRWWWKTRVARLEPRQRQVMAQVVIYQLKFCLTTRTPRKRTQARSQKKKKIKTTKEVTTSSSSAGGAFPSHYCPFSDQTSMTLELVRAHLAYPPSKNSLLLNATRPLSVSLPRVYFPANESFHLPTSGVLIKVP